MQESINRRFSTSMRGVAAALLASATVAPTLVHAWPAEKPILVQPAALPELARESGQAMFLHDCDDGRTLLYVEQSQGARLAIFDVTNPARIRSAGAVQLDAPGPFDFVADLGNRAEYLQFREGKGDAVLDLSNANAPALRSAACPALRCDGRLQDHRRVETDDLERFNVLLHAREIREQVTKRDTETTFLLTESGIYVIRHPLAERDKDRRDEERRIMYGGS